MALSHFTTLWIIRKRFAYLANENLRNFQRMQMINKAVLTL